MKLKLFALMLSAAAAVSLTAGYANEAPAYTKVTFEKIKLSDQFHAEGAGMGDFNKDGHKDLVIGSQWYEGPDFKKVHSFRPVQVFSPSDYSNAFSCFGMDFNGDEWDDIFIIDMPGKPAYWYENPKGKEGDWTAHEVYSWVGNESPDLQDVVGDERPELIFNIDGYLGYATWNFEHPDEPWIFHKVSHAKGAFFIYTHGIGVGDINGDGRKDFVEALGWWEQPESLDGDP
ncbi:MAG: VCBS repeat-containing protein, partial [Verrucomicrobia bacterium]|nr:VCBS repeat-containing protein [Verrucomicrobiota bacterium]